MKTISFLIVLLAVGACGKGGSSGPSGRIETENEVTAKCELKIKEQRADRDCTTFRIE